MPEGEWKTRMLKGFALASALLFAAQGSAVAAPVVSYVMTGSFTTPGTLEVNDAFSGDTVPDAELVNDPYFSYGVFTLSFDVDLGITGYIPLFSDTAVFESAVTNMSLSIDGNPYWSSSIGTARQTDPVNPAFPQVWSWGSDGTFNPPVDELIAIDSSTSGYLATLTPEFVDVTLTDTSNTIYASSPVFDLIAFDGSEFDTKELLITWVADAYDEDGNMIGDYEGFYELSGTVKNVAVTTVPVPAVAWLFGSGLLAFVGVARSRRAA